MDYMELLQQIFQVCIIPLLGVLTTYLVMFIKHKSEALQKETDNELYKKYIALLDETITKCVIATNQTYVDELREQGRFGPEEHEIAYHKTYDAIKELLTEEMKKVLQEGYSDLEFYISQLIQEQVNVIKFTRSAQTIIA